MRGWERVTTVTCPLTGRESHLLELRQDDPATGQVLILGRRCSLDLACNQEPELYCRWAYTNPDKDPLEGLWAAS